MFWDLESFFIVAAAFGEKKHLKVSQGISRYRAGISSYGATEMVSQATGLEFEYLKVSQGTGPVSQATGLRRWYLKLRGWNLSISRYLKVQGRYLKLRGWNLSISRYLKVQGRYLKLRGYGDGISSYGAGIWVSQGISSYGAGISSYRAGIWVSQGISSYGAGISSHGAGISSYVAGIWVSQGISRYRAGTSHHSSSHLTNSVIIHSIRCSWLRSRGSNTMRVPNGPCAATNNQIRRKLRGDRLLPVRKCCLKQRSWTLLQISRQDIQVHRRLRLSQQFLHESDSMKIKCQCKDQTTRLLSRMTKTQLHEMTAQMFQNFGTVPIRFKARHQPSRQIMHRRQEILIQSTAIGLILASASCYVLLHLLCVHAPQFRIDCRQKPPCSLRSQRVHFGKDTAQIAMLLDQDLTVVWKSSHTNQKVLSRFQLPLQLQRHVDRPKPWKCQTDLTQTNGRRHKNHLVSKPDFFQNHAENSKRSSRQKKIAKFIIIYKLPKSNLSKC